MLRTVADPAASRATGFRLFLAGVEQWPAICVLAAVERKRYGQQVGSVDSSRAKPGASFSEAGVEA